MWAFERRWADTVLSGFAPAGGGALAPAPGEADYAGCVEHMVGASTRLAAFGVRFALWMVYLAPLWSDLRPSTLASLPPARRAELLDRLLSHRLHLVRELALVLKLAACMALFRVPRVRERSGYDRRDDEPWEDVERSGERARVRLPLAADARGQDARAQDARGRDARGQDARGRDARAQDAREEVA